MSLELPSQALEALREVVEALEAAGFETMLVGGLATFAWGEPRTTRDLDVAVRLAGKDADAMRRVVARLGVEPQGPFSTHFGMRFILPFKGGMPVDLFLAAPEQDPEFARRRKVAVGGTTFWVQSPEDLVVRKLRTAEVFPEERAHDVADASAVLFKQWGRFDLQATLARAEAWGIRGRLEALAEETRAARQRAGLPA